MVQVDEKLIRSVVEQVLSRMNGVVPASVNGSYQGRFGLFTDVNSAVAAGREAFRAAVDRLRQLGDLDLVKVRATRHPHSSVRVKRRLTRKLAVHG